MYICVVLYFIYCFPVEGCSLAAESLILINYLVRERLYSFIKLIYVHLTNCLTLVDFILVVCQKKIKQKEVMLTIINSTI